MNGATKREEVTYACPTCGAGVLLITAATDGRMRGIFCRKCKKRQAVTLIGSTPAPLAPPPPRDVPPRASAHRPPVTPQIETRRIRDHQG